MPAYRLPTAYDRPPLRRRLSGLSLALALNLGLLFLLLGIGAVRSPVRKASQIVTFDLLPESRKPAAKQQRTKTVKEARAVTDPAARPVPKSPPIVLPVKPTITPPDKPLEMVELSKAEYAAADIGKLPKATPGSGTAGDSAVVGRGPRGELLYAAEWAREPTDAELGGYLPVDAPDGFGLIACRTTPGNRVDDCVELGQSPRGSRLAGAVRQAAWQFRVRPPRKDGKPLVGEWVQIRIDYIHSHRGE